MSVEMVDGTQFTETLCRALGIDPTGVVRIVVESRIGHFPRVIVERSNVTLSVNNRSLGLFRPGSEVIGTIVVGENGELIHREP